MRPQNFSDCGLWSLPLIQFKLTWLLERNFLSLCTDFLFFFFPLLPFSLLLLLSLVLFLVAWVFFSVVYKHLILKFFVLFSYSGKIFVVNLEMAPCWESCLSFCVMGPTVQFDNIIFYQHQYILKKQAGNEGKLFLLNMCMNCSHFLFLCFPHSFFLIIIKKCMSNLFSAQSRNSPSVICMLLVLGQWLRFLDNAGGAL